MFSKVSLILFVLVLAAAIVGFNLVPNIPESVSGIAEVIFFVLLVPFIISLFDVVGRTFRRS